MGLSIQGRAYSLHHCQSFMEVSRTFCMGGTQAHVPLTENQAAHVLGSLEAMPWGWVLAELVHSTEGLSGLCLASYVPPTLALLPPGHNPLYSESRRPGTTLRYVSLPGRSDHP